MHAKILHFIETDSIFSNIYLLFEQNHGDNSSKNRIFAAEIAILYNN